MRRSAIFGGLGLLLATAASWFAVPVVAQSPATITVFAAASTKNALDEIRKQFTASTGTVVQVSYASSSTLAQQVVNGADAQIFISADQKWANFLGEKQFIARRRNLLGNRLVVVVPADSPLKIQKLDDLSTAPISHLALGDPQAVPAGIYAKQAFTKLGIWDPIKLRVVAAEDVRHALAYVETGAAEAGIVYATDAAVSTKVKVALDVPAELTEPVRYPLVLLTGGQGNAAAEAFYRYLAGSEAGKVFTKYGFLVLNESQAGEK